ncbi:MAG: PAS domain-containing protein [Burkholderiales bacterium]|nr:PAS domain-containing protein [Burkholderiales bacterium]
MKFSFKSGVYLVLATTIAVLITIGGAYQLSVTENAEQTEAQARGQNIVSKVETLLGSREAVESAALAYIISDSAHDLQLLHEAEASCRNIIGQLAQLVAGDAEQQRGAAALGAAATVLEELQEQIVQLRRQHGVAEAVAFFSNARYRESERRFEQLAETMLQREHVLELARHDRVANRASQLGRVILWSGLLAVGLALFATFVIARQRNERRLAEANLREREKQYRLVTGSVPAMIGYVDKRHRVQSHNRAIEEWFDLPAERVADRHLAEIMGNDAYAAILPGIERALRGKRVEYEGKAYATDGSERVHAGTFIPDFDDAGGVGGFFALVIDITERKATEEALRASEERWKFALEGAGDGVWDRNMQTNEVMYSKRYKEMLGYSDDEFENRREEWERRIHPEDKARVMADLHAYLGGSSPGYATEYRMLCKDGSWKWILTRGMVVRRDAEGRPLRMIGTHGDISERVQRQQELIRANERLDLALHGSRLAIWDVDIVSGEIYVSEGWAEMLGDPPAATITDVQSLYGLVHPDDHKKIAEAFVCALKGTRPEYHVEHRVMTRAGRWKWVLSHGQVVSRDASGRALRMTGTNADISARKEVERMKDEFVAVVSHELRTPLSSIIGSLALLEKSAFSDPETKTLVRVARSNSQLLGRLVNDILDLEKLDSDTLQIQLEPVELEALLSTAIQANQGYAHQYGVSVTLSDSQGPAWVNANTDRLMQVMANLLSNAAKFSPRGANIEVRLARGGDAFRVSVIDHGPGIPEDFKPRVFERFSQADGSTSRQRGGTGLGLTICKIIVDKLGGNIGFVSTAGMGTTFYFDLPPYPQSDAKPMQSGGTAHG